MAIKIQLFASAPRLRLAAFQGAPWVGELYSTHHEHSFFELAVLLEGECSWRLGRRRIPMKGGESILIAPRQKHQEMVVAGKRARLAWLGFDFARGETPDDVRQWCHQAMPLGAWQEDMRNLCALIYRETQHSRRPGTDALVELSLRSVLVLLDRMTREETGMQDVGDRRTQAVRAAAYALASNLAAPPKISALARYHGFGAGRFAARFREEYGESPREFLQHRRLEEARRRLRESTLSIKEIAAACGYSDAAHFCHHFKRAMHVSPRVWRRRQEE